MTNDTDYLDQYVLEPGAGKSPDEPGATIVWLEDPTRYEYVRQRREPYDSPRARITSPLPGGRVIGYEVLNKRNPNGIYMRRFWWLKREDRPFNQSSPYGNGHYPDEAVVVRSVAPLVIERPKRRRSTA